MIEPTVRRRRSAVFRIALACLGVLLVTALAAVVVITQMRHTLWVGTIAVTADHFVSLGDGRTLAQGNVQLGDGFVMAGSEDQVVLDADSLTAFGTLALKRDNIAILSGWFSADGATGMATPDRSASSKLSRVAGFEVTRPISNLKVNIPKATTTGMAEVVIAAPGMQMTSTVGFTLLPGVFSGALPPLDFELSGVRLQAPGGAELTGGMIRIPKVTLVLPPEMGGGTTDLNEFTISAEGVSVAGVGTGFALPEIWFDGAEQLKLSGVKGNFVYDAVANTYVLDVAGNMTFMLPGNEKETSVNLTLKTSDEGPQLVGNLGNVSLDLGGPKLTLGDAVIDNYGLMVPKAILAVPPEMGGAVVTVDNVTIGMDGLGLSGGTFSLPDMILADGAVSVTGVKGELQTVEGEYRVSAEGMVNITLPDNAKSATISLAFSDAGLTGKLSGLDLNVAGANLVLGETALDANGLTCTNAQIVMPAELGGLSGKVDNVSITAEGLSFGTASLSGALMPDMVFGDALSLVGNNASLSVVRGADGDQYMLNVESTLIVNVSGTPKQEAIKFAMTQAADGSVDMQGALSGLALDLGGPVLSLSNVALTSVGLSAANTTLTLPPDLGGATVAINDVAIGADGLTVGGGSFTLPTLIIAEGLTIADVEAKFEPMDGAYGISAKGTLNIVLPGNTEATAISFAMAPDGQLAGTVKGLTLDLAGITLSLGDAALTADGISTTGATIKLPEELGGTTAMVGDASITAEGLSFGTAGLDIPLPAIVFGTDFGFINTLAKLSVTNNGEGFKLDATTTLLVNVDGNLVEKPAQFSMAGDPVNGFEMTGKVSGFNLNVGGVIIGFSEMVIGNTGLSAAEAALTLPAEMGGASIKIQDVGITADGLSIGGAIFALPDLSLADGAITISGLQAELVNVDGEYKLAAQGALKLNLAGNEQATVVTFKLSRDGELMGSLNGLSLDLGGGAMLELGETTLSSTGLSTSKAMFSLPAELGGLSGQVDNVSITAEGLSFGTATMRVPLPDLELGVATLSNNVAVLTAKSGAEGADMLVTIETSMSVPGVDGQMQAKQVRLYLSPTAGELAQTISPNGLVMNINGVLVGVEGLTN